MKDIEIKEEIYRSKPLVNMTEDMVRVTFKMTIKKWRMIKYLILNCEVAKKKDAKDKKFCSICGVDNRDVHLTNCPKNLEYP